MCLVAPTCPVDIVVVPTCPVDIVVVSACPDDIVVVPACPENIVVAPVRIYSVEVPVCPGDNTIPADQYRVQSRDVIFTKSTEWHLCVMHFAGFVQGVITNYIHLVFIFYS